MSFYCYLCSDRFFEDDKLVVKHLKANHRIKEKINQIKCTVKNSKCGKHFQTFHGLNRHVQNCLKDCTEYMQDEQIECEIIQNTKNRPKSLIFNLSDEQTGFPDEHNHSIVYDNDVNNTTTANAKPISFVLNSSDQSSQVEIETPGASTTNFFAGLLQLNLNETTINSIVKLTNTLLNKTHQFCSKSMQLHEGNFLEALDCSMNLFVDGLHRFNTAHKRKQFVRNHKSYIEPQQLAIGTHFEMKRDKTTGILEHVHKQSTFSYVSPLEILTKLFKQPHFHDTYFTYQSKKHTCMPGIYRDFCCGSTFQNINLYREHQNALQLQVFIDGFEVCSALKTKTTMHSQVAMYLSIRNMPEQFAHSMNNIHLICLVNENDLKKRETDYTNILEMMVRDIKQLETTGIYLDCGTNLKGKNNKKPRGFYMFTNASLLLYLCAFAYRSHAFVYHY